MRLRLCICARMCIYQFVCIFKKKLRSSLYYLLLQLIMKIVNFKLQPKRKHSKNRDSEMCRRFSLLQFQQYTHTHTHYRKHKNQAIYTYTPSNRHFQNDFRRLNHNLGSAADFSWATARSIKRNRRTDDPQYKKT